MSLTGVECEQLKEKYTSYELVDMLGLTVSEIIDVFEQEIEDTIEELLDKSRGIGL